MQDGDNASKKLIKYPYIYIICLLQLLLLLLQLLFLMSFDMIFEMLLQTSINNTYSINKFVK